MKRRYMHRIVIFLVGLIAGVLIVPLTGTGHWSTSSVTEAWC